LNAAAPRSGTLSALRIVSGNSARPRYKETVMGNFEDKDRDNKNDKPLSGQQGQQDRNKPGSPNEPGRDSGVPREGQSPSSTPRPGTSPGGKSRSESDEESA
jgi:hypothetical protein